MKMPKWLCLLFFRTCDWAWVQNTHAGGSFKGRYECRRCGAKSTGAPRNPFSLDFT